MSSIIPNPSRSGTTPAIVTSRRSRKLSVVFAATIQLASKWVIGDILGQVHWIVHCLRVWPCQTEKSFKFKVEKPQACLIF